MSGFRLLLKQHTPLLLTGVTPRLDRLLQEACSRLHQDWSRLHDLPLAWDAEQGFFRASQVIFGITAEHGLEARELGLPASVGCLGLGEAADPPRRVALNGSPTSPRLSRHKAYLAPYLLFYGEGDGQACAELLELLDGLGREYARAAGAFSVLEVSADASGQWGLRPWPSSADARRVPFEPVADHLSLAPRGESVGVLRPPRLIRERVA